MTIFDDIPRDDADPPHQDETAFAYLNRSGRAEAAKVRALVDDWLASYPIQHRDPLVARLRYAIDYQHYAAFFELFVHQLLVARGHQVVAVEPELPATKGSPDFLIETTEGHRLYMECLIATGQSQQEVAAEARLVERL